MLFLMLKVSVWTPKSRETIVYIPKRQMIPTFQVLSFPMSTSKNEKGFSWWSFSICFQVLGKSKSGSYLENVWSLQDKNLFLVLGWKQLVHWHRQLRYVPQQNRGRNVCRKARLSDTDRERAALFLRVLLKWRYILLKDMFRNSDPFQWRISKLQMPLHALTWLIVMSQSLLKLQRSKALGGC